MESIRILRVMFQNIPLFQDGVMEVNLTAMDKVSDASQVFNLHKNIYTQKLLSFIGINASGKTTSLKLIYFAMNVVINNASLNDDYDMVKEIIQDQTIMTVNFYYKGKYYQLESTIGKRNIHDTNKRPILYIINEHLRIKTKSTVITKKDIVNFTKGRIVEEIIRNNMSPNELALLKDDISIVIKITKDNSTTLEQMITETNFNVMLTRGGTPAVILNAFDPTLEELSCASESDQKCRLYTVKFKKNERMITVDNPFDLGNLVSSGTIKGQNLIVCILRVLRSGGYLFVDEIENHLNKEIIQMIMDIFKSEEINPNGACLVFSTHYPEILDFMERKDNIYITRRLYSTSYAIEVLNYASQVARNDVKKSEVILSNLVKGTAPLYENMEALKQILCQYPH